MDVIQKRNPSCCLSQNWCITCKAAQVDINHLFILCSRAISLWKKLQIETRIAIPLTNIKDLCSRLLLLHYVFLISVIAQRISFGSMLLQQPYGQFELKETIKFSRTRHQALEPLGEYLQSDKHMVNQKFSLQKLLS